MKTTITTKAAIAAGLENLLVCVNLLRKGSSDPKRDTKSEMAVKGADGRFYIYHNGRWWMLSNGDSGWHSINVGMPDNFKIPTA